MNKFVLILSILFLGTSAFAVPGWTPEQVKANNDAVVPYDTAEDIAYMKMLEDRYNKKYHTFDEIGYNDDGSTYIIEHMASPEGSYYREVISPFIENRCK